MARGFIQASSQDLRYDYGSNGNYISPPFSMGTRFQVTSANTTFRLMSIDTLGSNHIGFGLDVSGTEGGDPIRVWANNGAGPTTDAKTTSGPIANKWHHALGVWNASNDRRAYLDGGNKGTNSENISPASVRYIHIGSVYFSSVLYYHDGQISESAIWNVALTDKDAMSLATGVSPLAIRPESILFYWPLIRNNTRDIINGLPLTAYNSPAIVRHPRVFYLRK